ncbi:hypothetical protein [Ferrimonas pelagia]|uniref:Uncharacterized protein n=1 Tax=Ferrimonas pelagia TaxID=1177826 RepID=A0ABP9FD37_9GAMM
MTISIDARFNGPDGSGNGGYCAGRFAQAFAAETTRAVTVRLMAPPPLETALQLRRDAAQGQIWHGETQVASVAFADLSLTLPTPCTVAQACEASQGYVGFQAHPFPRCYVCGPDRAQGDGLRIFAGAVAGREMVAAPWQPYPDLAESSDRLAIEQIWAALDCPSYFGATLGEPGNPGLLGALTVQIHQRSLSVSERYLICAWPLGKERRKRFAGVALFSEAGVCLARGHSTWILLSPQAE